MLSSKQVAGDSATSPLAPGGLVRWVLVNDGTLAWPMGTTLRLVSGPVLASPILEVPSALPGQTLELGLEVTTCEKEHIMEANYCLVTPCGEPFGELLSFSVGKEETPKPPLCGILTAPQSIDALQGEMKTLKWTLTNAGEVDWPLDACCRLFYNTPGFEHLPAQIQMPCGVSPGLTVDVEVQALMPDKEGCFRAMWAVTSLSVPDFGEVLVAEFHVSDFPFMDWMLAEEENFSVVSETLTTATTLEAPAVLSATHLMHEHVVNAEVSYPHALNEGFVSLGQVSRVTSPWGLKILLQNEGTMPWPEDCSLKCCLGSGFGCANLPLGRVEPGEVIQLCLDLEAPLAFPGSGPGPTPTQTAWVLSTGDFCFGPVFLVEAKR